MIVTAGESLYDVFAREATAGGMTLDARVSGSAFNVAVGLARLGQPVAFLGSVEHGPTGDRIIQALVGEGVDVSGMERTVAPTSLNLVQLNPERVSHCTFYGNGGADRQLSGCVLDTLPSYTRAIHVGSYAMVVEPIATTLAALIDREHLRRVIAYDPNVRLNVEPDLDVWRERLEWMLPRTHLLKASAKDLALLYPGTSAHLLALKWRAAGVAVVIVTHGERGAYGWCAGGSHQLPACPTQVYDTLGAGDSFQAALLARLAERELLDWKCLMRLDADSLGSAMQFAARAAALTCSRRGANLPTRAELNGCVDPIIFAEFGAGNAVTMLH
jgi:fructokinase